MYLTCHVCRKETYLWLQGDIHRNNKANKVENIINNNDEDVINKNVSSTTRTVKCHIVDSNDNNDNNDNSINVIANEVSGLDLNDQTTRLDGLERSRKPRRSPNNSNSCNSSNWHSTNATSEEIETQGDHLNRIKAQRRNARSATAVTTPIGISYDDQRTHRRSASQSKEHDYLSPLKSLKPQFKSTTVSVYNTRSAIRRTQTVNVKEEDKPAIEMSKASTKIIAKSNNNSPNIKT